MDQLSLGKQLRSVREDHYISLRELSRMSNVHYTTIYMWEHDKVKPRIDSLVLVARALGVSIQEYTGGLW